MSNHKTPRKSYGFEGFLLDVAAERLTRDGQNVPLQPLQLKLLMVLLNSGASLVTREELREKVWQSRHVEFDQALNFAIRQLRVALGDNARVPRMIQTVPRRGYRFVASVEVHESDWTPPPSPERTGQWISAKVVSAFAATLILATIGFALLRPDVPVVVNPIVAPSTLAVNAPALRTRLVEAISEGQRRSLRLRSRPDLFLTVSLDHAGDSVQLNLDLATSPRSERRWRARLILGNDELLRAAADIAADVQLAGASIVRQSGGHTQSVETVIERSVSAPM